MTVKQARANLQDKVLVMQNKAVRQNREVVQARAVVPYKEEHCINDNAHFKLKQGKAIKIGKKLKNNSTSQLPSAYGGLVVTDGRTQGTQVQKQIGKQLRKSLKPSVAKCGVQVL